MADIAVKTEFWVVAIYALNATGERRSFFRRLEPFLDNSKWVVLVGDWNAILDPKLDKSGVLEGRKGVKAAWSISWPSSILSTGFVLITQGGDR